MSRKRPDKTNSTANNTRTRIQKYGPWIALILVLGLFAFIRWRLREMPLERDEGEYAYAGQLMLQGIPPYKLAYNMKLPGTYAAYAVLMGLFGQTAAGIHLGLLLVNTATSLMIFFLGRKLFSPWAGVVAAAAYASLSISLSVVGLAAHANHFVVLAAVGGLLLLPEKKGGSFRKIYLSGLLFGLGFLMKQHGILLGLFGGLWLVYTQLLERPVDWKRVSRNAGLFSAGIMTPFVLVCLVLWAAGVFDKFWYWTFKYAQSYASAGDLQLGWNRLREVFPEIAAHNEWLWGFAALGLLTVWLDRQTRGAALFLTGLLLISFVSVWPGFVFRPHYFILMLPAVALLCAGGVHFGLSFRRFPGLSPVLRWAMPLGFVGAFGWTFYLHSAVHLKIKAEECALVCYEDNPFPESVAVAQFIAMNSSPNDKIAVVGSEPQIYFYAKRQSATGYIYTYALMEMRPHAEEMQREMIREIETAKPEFLVFIGFPFSWLANPGSPRLIFEWFDRYAPEFYDKIGIVDYAINSVWGPEAASYTPQSDKTITIYKRRATEERSELSYLQQPLGSILSKE